MRKSLRIALLATVFLVVAGTGYFVGALSQYKRNQYLDQQMAAVQATLWFNHLKRFQELESDLSKGCSREALEKVKISIAEEMSLLASFYRTYEDPEFNKYVSARDPTLLSGLESYSNPYGTSWREPKCAK